MGEMVPIILGAMMGVAARYLIRSRIHRFIVLVAGACVGGFAAALINGELGLSAGFVLVDFGIVLLSASVSGELFAWLVGRRRFKDGAAVLRTP